MNRAEQLKLKYKNARLLQQYVQSQAKPSTVNQSLEISQPTQEQFRDSLPLFQVGATRQKQQEAQVLMNASNERAVKDKGDISQEEDVKSPKAETELAEDIVPDQRIEPAKKVLAGEKSVTTSSDLHMLDRQREDDTLDVCQSTTKAASAKTVFLSNEMAQWQEKIEEAERQVEKRKQARATQYKYKGSVLRLTKKLLRRFLCMRKTSLMLLLPNYLFLSTHL